MQSKAQIDQILRQKSDAKEIPGVVAIAANGKKVIYQGAFGKRDSTSGVDVTPLSIFRIASMTKAITTVAALQLVEKGQLSLDEPVAKHLPELGKLEVLEGFDNAGKPILRPVRSRSRSVACTGPSRW